MSTQPALPRRGLPFSTRPRETGAGTASSTRPSAPTTALTAAINLPPSKFLVEREERRKVKEAEKAAEKTTKEKAKKATEKKAKEERKNGKH